MFHPDTESAIEREIRLAHEREDMLRMEKEERGRIEKKFQQQQEQQPQQQTIIASYEAALAESESCQPAFNELTEADRGPETWGGRAQAVEEEVCSVSLCYCVVCV